VDALCRLSSQVFFAFLSMRVLVLIVCFRDHPKAEYILLKICYDVALAMEYLSIDRKLVCSIFTQTFSIDRHLPMTFFLVHQFMLMLQVHGSLILENVALDLSPSQLVIARLKDFGLIKFFKNMSSAHSRFCFLAFKN
jgi:hypothetical protein